MVRTVIGLVGGFLRNAACAACVVTASWLPGTLHAQGAAGEPNSEPADAGTIVFVVPADLAADTRTSLEDALLTGLSLVEARLLLVDGPSGKDSLPIEERVVMSKKLAAEHGAEGVLWLDVRLTDHWFVYTMDAEAERVVVRPLLVRSESVPAAVEAVAVIARSSAQALLHGEPVAGVAVIEAAPAPPPTAAPAPAAPAEEPSHLRLSAAYIGTTFAPDLVWQSGVAIGAAWWWPEGPFVAIGYAWFPAHRFGDDLVFSVQRRPFSLGGGYALRLADRLVLAGSLAATLDIQSRHTVKVPAGIGAGADATRVLVAVSPTISGELSVTSWLGVFLAVGADAFLNDFDYVSGPAGSSTELDPHRVRFRALVGAAIIH